MQFDIVIPSHHRTKRLTECLESIAINFASNSELYKNVRVMVYLSDPEEYHSFKYSAHWLSKGLFLNYRAPDFWNNHLSRMMADVMVTINDDIVLLPGTLQHLVRSYETRFPSADGVLGLNQFNIPMAEEYSFLAIGAGFARSFPGKQVFCPDYERFFADEELGKYAKESGKFFFDTDVKIVHMHASFYPELIDETHNAVRMHWPKDNRTHQLRQGSGFLWGKDFNRLQKEEVANAI
jgi:hypothetical protein